MSTKINLLNLGIAEMETFFAELGEPRFRATQMLKWVHQHGETDFSKMTNYSKSLREKLIEHAEITPPKIILEQKSSDGTRKWVMQVDERNSIETVLIPEDDRATLCVSSQVGCSLNCDFCSTARQGFNRNLSVAEIIGQVWVAVRALSQDNKKHNKQVTNVVMMGMGEPLLNFDNVVKAMALMLDDNCYNLSKYRVTLSTSGVLPAMRALRKVSDVALAVSLHAPNDILRDKLVPINKKYPLKELLAICKDYFVDEPRRYVTMEYVMLEGVNDQVEHAKELIKCLKGIRCKVNLIPFNPFPNTPYRRSSHQAIEQFRQILKEAGINTIPRRTRGDDIDAACGQLVGKVNDRTQRSHKFKIIDLKRLDKEKDAC